MQEFTKNVIDTILAIPAGYVATYGQVASLSGNPQAARQVARVLHSMSAKYGLPWHRVVNSKGRIVLNDPEGRQIQKQKLEAEGILVSDQFTISLEKFQWLRE